MRAVMWATAVLLILGAAGIVYVLTKQRVTTPNILSQGPVTLTDMVGVVSLALNVVLMLISVVALLTAFAAYRASEASGRDQQVALDASRKAMEATSEILKASASDFRSSAEAAKGQYALLQQAQSERDRSIVSALHQEADTNAALLAAIRGRLEIELKIIPEGKTLVSPLPLLHTGAWGILKVSIPQRLLTPNAITKLAETYRLAEAVNETLRSRESYRLQNGAMSNFQSRMGLYDQDLLETSVPLVDLLKEVKAIIAP